MSLASAKNRNGFFERPITKEEMEELKDSPTKIYKGFTIVEADSFFSDRLKNGDKFIYLEVGKPDAIVTIVGSKDAHMPVARMHYDEHKDKYFRLITLKTISDGTVLDLDLDQYFKKYILLYIVNITSPDNTGEYWPGPVIKVPKRNDYSLDKYVKNRQLPLNSSNDDRLFFSDALNAELNARFYDYERVKDPRLGDKLIYIEQGGPTLYGTVTRHFTSDIFQFTPNTGKAFYLDKIDEGIDYLLLKPKGRVAGRTRRNRENFLRRGPHPRDKRFKGGFKSRRASRRSVIRR